MRLAVGTVAVVVLLGTVALAGCHRGARTPEGAYLELEKAVKNGDGVAFFATLDQETRWSIESVFSDERMMRTIIAAKYPEAEAQKELARLSAAEESDAAHYFAHVDRERQILARYGSRLAQASGRVEVVAGDDETLAVVARQAGPTLRFHRDKGGRWGFGELGPEWALEKDRAAHAVKTVRENAALYQKAEEK
jgi:hypothetical protein